MSRTQLILYSTDHCTACGQALDLLLSMPDLRGLSVQVVDIAQDDDLLERLGERIPVLGLLNGALELAWPFDRNAVLAWLRKVK